MDRTFSHVGLMRGGGGGGGGVVVGHYVTLGGVPSSITKQVGLRGGGGCQVFRKKALHNT